MSAMGRKRTLARAGEHSLRMPSPGSVAGVIVRHGHAPRTVEPTPDPLEDMSLPGWLYHDPEFFEAEKRAFLRAAPQVVCHESEIAEPGEWRTLEYLGESVIVIRGDDGEVRAFSNVCRHRGSRLVDGDGGCAKVLTCPYHAWSYARDGRLVGVPHRARISRAPDREDRPLPGRAGDLARLPVRPLEPGAPSVAEMMAPYEHEVAPYRFEELRAIGRVTLRPRAAQLEDHRRQLFRPSAHPGRPSRPDPPVRQELQIEAQGACRPDGGRPGREALGQSVRARLPESAAEGDHLPATHRRKWLYYKLFPNVAFDIYPDQVDFMQFLPVSATETVIREISYALPDERREMQAARYLNWRINRQVNAEDTELITRVQLGMQSPTYVAGPLGTSEVCLRSFATSSGG